jgi:hypothetical protein
MKTVSIKDLDSKWKVAEKDRPTVGKIKLAMDANNRVVDALSQIKEFLDENKSEGIPYLKAIVKLMGDDKTIPYLEMIIRLLNDLKEEVNKPQPEPEPKNSEWIFEVKRNKEGRIEEVIAYEEIYDA